MLNVTNDKNAALFLTPIHHTCITTDVQLLLYDFITHILFQHAQHIFIHKINNLIEPFETTFNDITFQQKVNHITVSVKAPSPINNEEIRMVLMEYVTTTTNSTTITKAFSTFFKDFNVFINNEKDGYKAFLRFEGSQKQKYFHFYELDFHLIKVKIFLKPNY